MQTFSVFGVGGKVEEKLFENVRKLFFEIVARQNNAVKERNPLFNAFQMLFDAFCKKQQKDDCFVWQIIYKE
jgi:hypothetical protein